MKAKHIYALLAFAAAFSISVTAAGLVKSLRGMTVDERILNVLNEDISNGFSSRRLTRGNPDLDMVSTNVYVSKSERISTEGLPEEFREAWAEHMKAWRDHADFLYERETARTSHTNQRDHRQALAADERYSRNSAEISRTWYKVLQIAVAHGVEIPRNAL